MKFDWKKSEMLLGFAIALALYFVKKLLISQGIIIPDGEWELIIQFITYAASCYGVIGLGKWISKVNEIAYNQNRPLPGTENTHLDENYADNLSQLEEDFKDKQYKDDFLNKPPYR